jgi:hypothetical protein
MVEAGHRARLRKRESAMMTLPGRKPNNRYLRSTYDIAACPRTAINPDTD